MDFLEKDQRIFQRIIARWKKKKSHVNLSGHSVVEIGKLFIGTPYVPNTLDTEGAERLVVRLKKLDCVTFVENVIALTTLLTCRNKTFEAFQKLLEKIRYRQGRLQGYGSRLHYFSDWIYDNQKKGVLRDVTAETGGRPFKKTLNFMTTHPELHPRLGNKPDFQAMISVEKTISRRSLTFIPKKSLRRLENRINEGDVIAITTDREGLDVQHAGFAVKKNRRVYLLHASSKEGKVVLSRKTLYRYLTESRFRSGIMVARVESGK